MLSHISGYFHPIFERWIKLIDGRIERVCSYTRIFPRLRKRLAILKITDIEVELAERNSWKGGRKEVTKLLELSNEEKRIDTKIPELSTRQFQFFNRIMGEPSVVEMGDYSRRIWSE